MGKYTGVSNQELLNAYKNNPYDPEVTNEIYNRKYNPGEPSKDLEPPGPPDPTPLILPSGNAGVQAPAGGEGGGDAETNAILAGGQRGGAGQPAVNIPKTMWLSSGSRTVAPGAYSEDTAAKLADIHRQQAAAKQAEIERMEDITGVSRTGKINETRQPTVFGKESIAGLDIPTNTPPEKTQVGYLTDWAQAHQAFKSSIAAEQAETGKDKTKRQEQLNKAELALQDADENLKNAKIDPDRFYSGAKGIFRGVLATIGMAFGAYAQGISGGKIPNTAASIIENAINRDMEAQKANIDILLKQRGYAKETRDYVAGRLDSSLAQYKANQLRIGELDIAHKAALTKKPELILAASKTITDLDSAAKKSEMAAVLAMEASRPKVTKTGSSHQVINPEKQGKYPPSEPGKEMRLNVDYMRKVDDLVKRYKLLDPSRFTTLSQFFNKDADEFGKELATLTDSYRHSTTGAAFTEQERKNYEKRFGAGLITSWGPTIANIQKLRNSARDNALRIMKMYPQYTNMITSEDASAIRMGLTPNKYTAGQPAEERKPIAVDDYGNPIY